MSMIVLLTIKTNDVKRASSILKSMKFKEGKEQNRSLLIGFITAGDPSIELTSKLAEAMVKGGVDIIELGIPFSDPIADGPTIQSSSMRSLSNGTTTKDILDTSKKIVENLNVPVVLLTYYNTIMKIGTNVFLQEAAKAKISGIVSPDLPPEEGKEYIKLRLIQLDSKNLEKNKIQLFKFLLKKPKKK